jgi:aminoglycoside phosphotransferase
MTSVVDGWPDDLALLAGPAAGALLAGAVGELGGQLESWKAQQVSHRPGASTVAHYRAGVRWADGRRSDQTLVASTTMPVSLEVGRCVASRRGVTVWLWPHDPALPGLAPALDRRRLASLLRDLGLPTAGRPEAAVRSYRPGRRAVVEVTTTAGARLFLKVVRPGRAAALHRRHRLLAPHLPVPESLGWTADGILVLSAVPGTTLRAVLRSSAPAPAPADLLALLDRLPAEVVDLGPARRPLDRVDHDARVLAATVPALAARAVALAGRLVTAAATTDAEPTVAVHGDLYDAQLVVDTGRFTGLLDVDGAGAGARADDLANALGHLAVMAQGPSGRGRFARYLADLQTCAEAVHGPRVLRPRVAAAVLALATGPFRAQQTDWAGETERRLAVAEGWGAPVGDLTNGP